MVDDRETVNVPEMACGILRTIPMEQPESTMVLVSRTGDSKGNFLMSLSIS